ncbi:ser/Thr phosphatase family protein [Clostridium sp. CAG:452]|nr:ser/Thr phosphatase family protein [Clostridium sp. CAG:452]
MKTDEELVELGYDSPDELEKLRNIEKNMNNSDQYLNAIRESIKASKDIDAEIDRKMELAKSIIKAKKRGESLPSNLNPNLQKDKFEKANKYIASTTTLKRIPVIQNEYIKNNYIAERRYNNLIRNNNNVNRGNASNNRVVTSTATVSSTLVINNVVSTANIVTKKIPDRKNVVYSNFEKKLDKDNDLTKQKIKARTELKLIFKEIENKELLGEDVEELNSKIENIKKKYPNTITDKALDRLYDKYNVQIKVNETEQQIQNAVENIEQEAQAEIEEIKQNIEEKLENVKTSEAIEDTDNSKEKTKTIELQEKANEVIDSINNITISKPKAEIKIESPSTKIRQKTTKATLGALEAGKAVATAIGTLKKKSEAKIDDLKKKGEDLVKNIVEQQKDAKKKKNTKAKKETTPKTNKAETSHAQSTTNPIKTENSISEESQTEKTTQIEEKSKNVSNNSKMSKEELMKALEKVSARNPKNSRVKGINLLVINKLVCYLKENDDPEIQMRLSEEIKKLQKDRTGDNEDNLCIYDYKFTNPKTLYYMYDKYKDGVKSNDGSREIIPANKNASSYYLYLAYNLMQGVKKEKEELQSKIKERWEVPLNITQKVEKDFIENKEKVCEGYYDFLEEKYNLNNLDGIERLKSEYFFVNELTKANENEENSEYLKLALATDIVKRPGSFLRPNNYKEKEYLEEQLQRFDEKIKDNREVEPRILKLWGNLFYNGLKGPSDKEIIPMNKAKAKKIYEQLIDRDKNCCDADVYYNLYDIYNDNTTPLFDKNKANKILKTIERKKLSRRNVIAKNNKNESNIYVCSDLHGNYNFYKAITRELKENDRLYVLGDVIDRGKDGIKILQDVIKRKEKGQVEFLVGNHELMMVQSLFLNNEKVRNDWLIDGNGGKKTLEEFNKLDVNEQNKMKEFLLNSYVYKNIKINDKPVHLVHAKSIQDKEENNEKTLREMIKEEQESKINEALWSRDPKTGTSKPHPQSAKPGVFTVIGHSPTADNKVNYKDNYIDIDCGGGYHYCSLINLTKGTVKYIDEYFEEKKEKIKNEKSR